MPFAILPGGRTEFVKKNVEVSVAVPGPQARAEVERTLEQALAQDPRRLFVRVQGGGGYGPWCFWIQWGQGNECCATPPVMLSEQEHTPEAILSRVKAELTGLQPATSQSA